MYTWAGIQNTYFTAFSDPSYELMQYTGLKDKNRVEIYEGDVLTITDYPYKELSQEKDKTQPFYKTEKVIYDPPCFNLNGWLEFDLDCEYEVIGNIHENPELIKEDDPA